MSCCAVARFCGNVYAAPPDRCDVRGHSIDGADSGHLAASRPRDAGGVHGLAAAQTSPPPGLRTTTNE